jgi:C-terminal processing protease CtpA/Prc
MKRHIHIAAAVLALTAATPLAAQKPCSGPGASFGVTSYQCASCGIEQKSGQRMQFIFHAEPLILQTSTRSALRQGDVIEAVNGKPITTREGAELFTYPTGATQIMVRRGGSRTVVGALPFASCKDETPDSTDVGRREALAEKAVTVHPSSFAQAGRFGFSLTCLPSCTRIRASNGVEYWRYDAVPAIGGLDPDGPAAKSGLRIGDMVLEIDGRSVLEEEGALRLLNSGKERSLRLTIQRADGTKATYTLTPRK